MSERPQPREDGSYERPMWEGRWLDYTPNMLCFLYDVDYKDGILAFPRAAYSIDDFGKSRRWYPVPPIPGLDVPVEKPAAVAAHAVGGEWRRGGPGQTPIDRVGVWQSRLNSNDENPWVFRFELLEPESRSKQFRQVAGQWYPLHTRLIDWQEESTREWRFVRPLDEPAETGKSQGDRQEAFWKASRLWNKTSNRPAKFKTADLVFLASPAGRAAVKAFWGEKTDDTRCECRFEDGMLIDECHYHECIRCVCDDNGDPTGEPWDHRAKLAEHRLSKAKREIERLTKERDDIEAALESALERERALRKDAEAKPGDTTLTLAEKRALLADVDPHIESLAKDPIRACAYMKLAADVMRAQATETVR